MLDLIEENRKQKILYYLLTGQMIFLIILPPLDGQIDIIRAILYAVFAIISAIVVVMGIANLIAMKKKERDISFFVVLTFYLICGLSSCWALKRGVLWTDVIRGIIPFAWYINIIIIEKNLTCKIVEKMNRILSVMALVYAARIFIYYFIYVWGKNGERVTFHLSKGTSIVPMIGTIIYLYLYIVNTNKTNILRYIIGMTFCFISIILTQTKSMLLAVWFGIFILLVGVTLLKNSQIDKKEMLIKYSMAIAILGGCTLFLLAGTNLGSRWSNMVTIQPQIEQQIEQQIEHGVENKIEFEKGSVSVRIIEIKTAVEHYKKSIFFGEGIGYRWTAEGLDYGGPVIYMHNIIAFLMMDFGSVGIVYLLIIMFMFVYMELKVIKANAPIESKLKFQMSLSIIIMAFVYANFFAIFRNIEFTILCAFYIGKLLLEKKQLTNGGLVE